jgi:GT2 family glycosyltransferase
LSVDKLRVIIVNYKTARFAIRCVQSLLAHRVATESQIFIVDNDSPDDSVEILLSHLPGIHLVQSDTNAGFGAGVNLGASGSTEDYILVLNPDTAFESNSLKPVLDYLDANSDVGLVGLDLVNTDGSRQYSARRFYALLDIFGRRAKGMGTVLERRMNRHLMKKEWAAQKPFDAEWVMGTGFVVRGEVFRAIGGMDDHYFLYMEDLDLCARIWHAGYRVRAIPGAKLLHEHQRASAKGLAPLASRAGREHIRSLFIFARKFTLPLLKQPGIDAVVAAYARSARYARESLPKAASDDTDPRSDKAEDMIGVQ